MALRVWVGDRARRIVRAGAAAAVVTTMLVAAHPADAQKLVHRFVNPSFGGNPFNSDHLIGIANLQRPAAPETPATPVPSEEELLARQLRSQFLAQLSGEIRSRILNAQPGDTGAFDLGDQRVSFVRTATETRVTFINSRTGEEDSLVIPVSSSVFPFGTTAQRATGELALGASPLGSSGALLAPDVTARGAGANSVSSLLGSRSLELPLGGQ